MADDITLDQDTITSTPKGGVPDWSRSGAWDTLYLAGEALPGIARVDIELPSGLDVQRPKGGKKACVKDEGIPPAEVNVELEMLYEHVAAFEKRINLLRPKAVGKGRDPVEVTHPLCALWGINIVQIGQVSNPSPRAGGSFVVNFTLVEWVPQPKTQKKSTKPKTDPNAGDYSNIDALIGNLNTGRQSRVDGHMTSGDDGKTVTPPRTP